MSIKKIKLAFKPDFLNRDLDENLLETVLFQSYRAFLTRSIAKVGKINS